MWCDLVVNALDWGLTTVRFEPQFGVVYPSTTTHTQPCLFGVRVVSLMSSPLDEMKKRRRKPEVSCARGVRWMLKHSRHLGNILAKFCQYYVSVSRSNETCHSWHSSGKAIRVSHGNNLFKILKCVKQRRKKKYNGKKSVPSDQIEPDTNMPRVGCDHFLCSNQLSLSTYSISFGEGLEGRERGSHCCLLKANTVEPALVEVTCRHQIFPSVESSCLFLEKGEMYGTAFGYFLRQFLLLFSQEVCEYSLQPIFENLVSDPYGISRRGVYF